jgi:hypothetical protein
LALLSSAIFGHITQFPQTIATFSSYQGLVLFLSWLFSSIGPKMSVKNLRRNHDLCSLLYLLQLHALEHSCQIFLAVWYVFTRAWESMTFSPVTINRREEEKMFSKSWGWLWNTGLSGATVSAEKGILFLLLFIHYFASETSIWCREPYFPSSAICRAVGLHCHNRQCSSWPTPWFLLLYYTCMPATPFSNSLLGGKEWNEGYSFNGLQKRPQRSTYYTLV